MKITWILLKYKIFDYFFLTLSTGKKSRQEPLNDIKSIEKIKKLYHGMFPNMTEQLFYFYWIKLFLKGLYAVI